MNWSKFTIFAVICTILSCTKPPDYPLEPVIAFKSLSRTSLPQGSLLQDSLLLTITFTDGDGDIGSEETQFAIFAKDLRTGFESISYSIPFVPEQGAGNGISGEISFPIYTSCCIHPVTNQICMPFMDFPQDTLVYEIYIIDRAENVSNVITSDPIYLRCE